MCLPEPLLRHHPRWKRRRLPLLPRRPGAASLAAGCVHPPRDPLESRARSDLVQPGRPLLSQDLENTDPKTMKQPLTLRALQGCTVSASSVT